MTAEVPFSSFPPKQRARIRWAILFLGGGGIVSFVPLFQFVQSVMNRETIAIGQKLDALSGQVSRLEAASKKQAEDLAFVRGQLTPVANLRGQVSEADSHLAQPGGPDVAGARRVLAQ